MKARDLHAAGNRCSMLSDLSMFTEEARADLRRAVHALAELMTIAQAFNTAQMNPGLTGAERQQVRADALHRLLMLIDAEQSPGGLTVDYSPSHADVSE